MTSSGAGWRSRKARSSFIVSMTTSLLMTFWKILSFCSNQLYELGLLRPGGKRPASTRSSLHSEVKFDYHSRYHRQQISLCSSFCGSRPPDSARKSYHAHRGSRQSHRGCTTADPEGAHGDH